MFLVVLHLVSLLLLSGADVQHHQVNATEKQLGGGLDCGSVLRGTEIRLVSPGYPLPPPPGLTCFYVIEAAHPSICFIELTFLTFDLGDCGATGDSLEVAGQVLCGGRTAGSRSFRFNPPRSLVVFRSGESTRGKGFEILLRQQQCPVPAPAAQPDCSAAYSAPQFYIQGPTRRPIGRVCEYTIIGSNRPLALCQVELLFEYFDLEATAGCTGERLEVGDQDILCGILTGTRLYHFIGLLRIRYISTKESIGNGFRILVVQKGCRQLVLSNSGGGLPPSVPLPTPPPFQPSPPGLGPNFPHLPPIYPALIPNIPPLLPLCCGIIYASRHFYLASPGFPYYQGDTLKECLYRIRRSGPDVCQIRLVFRFFWLGKEDSYIGCLNNGYLQLDDGQRICGCKSGAVIVSPFYQDQEKVLHYRGYNGGGFLLEIFQESCSDPGWFGGIVGKVPLAEEFYPFSASKERNSFNVNTQNTTTSILSESSNNMNISNNINTKTFPVEYSMGFRNKERSFGSGVRSMNITLEEQQVNTHVFRQDNTPRVSEVNGSYDNPSSIKEALNKNCKVSWKVSVYDESDKQLLPYSNKSNEPSDQFLLKNESQIMFTPAEKQSESGNKTQQGTEYAPLASFEDRNCKFGSNPSKNEKFINKTQEYRSPPIVDYFKNHENKRNRRSMYAASPQGFCYSWTKMVQEARHFIWVNGISRSLCPGSQRCKFLAEVAGWVKIPGYPSTYPNNINLCFG